MTVTTLPLYSEASYTYVAGIESLPFNFRFKWNERSLAWHLDLYTDGGVDILLGQKLVVQAPMTWDFALEQFGLKGFFILEPKNTAQGALLMTQPQELAERFQFLYITGE